MRLIDILMLEQTEGDGLWGISHNGQQVAVEARVTFCVSTKISADSIMAE